MKVSEEELKELARLEKVLNGSQGIRCVRTILTALEAGDYESAMDVRRVEGDKTRYYPDIELILYKIFGCRLHGIKGCQDWLCK